MDEIAQKSIEFIKSNMKVAGGAAIGFLVGGLISMFIDDGRAGALVIAACTLI